MEKLQSLLIEAISKLVPKATVNDAPILDTYNRLLSTVTDAINHR